MTIESILSQCSTECVQLSVDLTGMLDVRCARKKISYDLKKKLKSNKPEIINYLRQSIPPPSSRGNNKNFTDFLTDSVDSVDTVESSKGENNTESVGIEPIHAEPQVTLSFEELVSEITQYKNVLEQTYLDADNDGWHGDGMSEKFRSQDHTYEEMKKALARFIDRVHRHEEEADTASLAFRFARDALPEYQKYMKVLRVYNNSDPKSVEEVRLLWQSCLKAYESMPEHKAFMAAKKRQALFYPLTTRQPSQGHIQELIDSLS